MQQNCYRCGRSIEEQLAFCSSCGAPQIRVSRPAAPEELSDPPDQLASGIIAGQNATVPESSADLARAMAGIDWKHFFRTAAPLAALIGMVTVRLAPLGLFLLLPAGSIWAISRYRQQRTGPLRGGQGARMGAATGLLAFGFFLALSLVGLSFNWTKYCEAVNGLIRERIAQTPDLPSQQVLQWFTTPDGMLTFTVIALATVLVAFLVIGTGSGALAVALGNTRNRP